MPVKPDPPSSRVRSRKGRPPKAGPAVVVRNRTVRVDGRAARWIAGGHPWVFRDSVRHFPAARSGSAGVSLLEIRGPENESLGCGYLVGQGAIAVRVLTTRHVQAEVEQILRENFEHALDLRKRMLPSGLTAYRVIHGDGDGFSGVNVDRYGQHAVMYQLCPEADFLVDVLKDWVGEALGLDGIYLQERFGPLAGKGPPAAARLVWGRAAEVEQTVTENGLKFIVDVTAPVNPGLFLDQRLGRGLVGSLAEGLKVLNCFSHTGGFTVYALAGRAEKVVSVDLSRRYHSWAIKNLALNGLERARSEFLASDAASELARLARRDKKGFHLAIVDPPTFSAGKKRAMSLTRDYPDLMASVLQVLAPSGMVLSCCNTGKLTERDFLRLLAEGSHRSGRRLNVIQRIGLPCDFPVPAGFVEGHYMKTFLLRAD